MRITRFCVSLGVLCCFTFFSMGCHPLKDSTKYQFSEGYYKTRLNHKRTKKVYVVPEDDSIKIYSLKRIGMGLDTTQALKIAFPLHEKPKTFENYYFKKGSFDFDVLNVLFKFRPGVQGFPPQFNNNILNLAFYVGRRKDFYELKYKLNPLGVYTRSLHHFGYSAGFFSGVGGTRIDEFVTLGRSNIQYDGVVNLSGLALIMAVDKVNFGITAGMDHLLDKHSSAWIYQGRMWLGLSIGFNLN